MLLAEKIPYHKITSIRNAQGISLVSTASLSTTKAMSVHTRSPYEVARHQPGEEQGLVACLAGEGCADVASNQGLSRIGPIGSAGHAFRDDRTFGHQRHAGIVDMISVYSEAMGCFLTGQLALETQISFTICALSCHDNKLSTCDVS